MDLILRISAISMLLGRAYQHIRWGGPFRDIFYHPQGLGGWYASFINRPLGKIYNDHFYEHALDYFSDFVGLLFILTSVFILFQDKFQKHFWVLYASTLFLLLDMLGLYYGKNLEHQAIIWEHSGQIIAPWLCYWLHKGKRKRVFDVGVIAIAITFISHGLYAFGYYSQPGKFIDMIILSTGWSESFTREILWYAGLFDFIFAAVLLIRFIPKYQTMPILKCIIRCNLVYGVFWGFLTSFTRLWFSYEDTTFINWIDQYGFEFVVRIPHFLIPLFLFKGYQSNN